MSPSEQKQQRDVLWVKHQYWQAYIEGISYVNSKGIFFKFKNFCFVKYY